MVRNFTGNGMNSRNISTSGAIIAAAMMIAEEKPACRVCVLLASMEEVGCIGAKADAFAVQPDRCIAVDVSFGDGFGCRADQTAPLGAGPMLGFAPILNREFTLRLKALAAQYEIPLQHEAMGSRTGTDADSIAPALDSVYTHRSRALENTSPDEGDEDEQAVDIPSRRGS